MGVSGCEDEAKRGHRPGLNGLGQERKEARTRPAGSWTRLVRSFGEKRLGGPRHAAANVIGHVVVMSAIRI